MARNAIERSYTICANREKNKVTTWCWIQWTNYRVENWMQIQKNENKMSYWQPVGNAVNIGRKMDVYHGANNSGVWSHIEPANFCHSASLKINVLISFEKQVEIQFERFPHKIQPNWHQFTVLYAPMDCKLPVFAWNFTKRFNSLNILIKSELNWFPLRLDHFVWIQFKVFIQLIRLKF